MGISDKIHKLYIVDCTTKYLAPEGRFASIVWARVKYRLFHPWHPHSRLFFTNSHLFFSEKLISIRTIVSRLGLVLMASMKSGSAIRGLML